MLYLNRAVIGVLLNLKIQFPLKDTAPHARARSREFLSSHTRIVHGRRVLVWTGAPFLTPVLYERTPPPVQYSSAGRTY
jgi:hypothetical protein